MFRFFSYLNVKHLLFESRIYFLENGILNKDRAFFFYLSRHMLNGGKIMRLIVIMIFIDNVTIRYLLHIDLLIRPYFYLLMLNPSLFRIHTYYTVLRDSIKVDSRFSGRIVLWENLPRFNLLFLHLRKSLLRTHLYTVDILSCLVIQSTIFHPFCLLPVFFLYYGQFVMVLIILTPLSVFCPDWVIQWCYLFVPWEEGHKTHIIRVSFLIWLVAGIL